MITTSKALVEETRIWCSVSSMPPSSWYNYLYGDNAAANELIKKDNPEMTDGQLAYSLAKMKEYGIVDSGDTEEKGIGCMTDEHFKAFFDTLASIAVVDASLDYKQSYTTDFVCKGVGLDLKK